MFFCSFYLVARLQTNFEKKVCSCAKLLYFARKNKMKNRGKSRIMKNYKNFIASTKWLKRVILSGTEWSRRICVGALFAAFCFFTACDDSSSGAGPDPVAEISSSCGDEAISSSEKASSGGSSVSSSNSKGYESASSSSEQMNSSFESGKNSSSSVVESSSSEGCPFNGRNEDGSAYLHCPFVVDKSSA